MSTSALEAPIGRAPLGILHDPLPGTGYRALRRLGGGATSEVYAALGPDRGLCAVKVLRSLFADRTEPVFRLEQEGRALAALDHPSLLPVLDAGKTSAGRPYFVMPLLEGETVKARLARRGRIAPAEACEIVVDVLGGLDAAHGAGVVHRDVKPANVFLPRPGAGLASSRRCVLLDFGIAKRIGARGGPTTGSEIVGSPRYLAPEQIVGGAIDARTDVYAAGLLLFEMIAGRGAVDAPGPIALMRAHIEEEPPRLRDLEIVTRELGHAVARALAKPPSRRWPSARVFAAVLERAAMRERERTGLASGQGRVS